MEKEFIPYEQALALKELGFDKDCFKHWDAENQTETPYLTYTIYGGELYEQDFNTPFEGNEIRISAPLYQQAFRWFREKYGLMHIINPYHFTAEINYLRERIVDEKHGDFIPHNHLVDDEGEEIKHSSYEEAELECLKELIKIVKEKK